jgi:hypothetical protein
MSLPKLVEGQILKRLIPLALDCIPFYIAAKQSGRDLVDCQLSVFSDDLKSDEREQ